MVENKSCVIESGSDLRIAGFQKNSFIDYPGNICCVVFTSGCNFRCPYCHNPETVKGSGISVSESDLFVFLKKRHGLLDGVVISGGEPTLQPGLLSFCKKLRLLNYKIKLDTNGSDSGMIGKLVSENLVDYIAMDIKTDPGSYHTCFSGNYHPSEIRKSIRLIKESGIAYEFRTTCLSPFVDRDIIDRIGQFVDGSPLYVLQRFRSDSVLDREFCEQSGRKIPDEEILLFQKMLECYTESCMIR